MNFDLAAVLTRAGQITWKHKILWAFQALPVLASFLIFPLLALPVLFLEGSGGELSGASELALAIGAPLLVVIFFTVNMALSSFAMAAASGGIVRAERGADTLALAELIEDGKRHFARILGVLLAIHLSVGAVFSIFFLMLFVLIMVTMGIAAICMQPLIILISPLSFLMMAVMEAAQTAIVAEDAGIVEALRRGWNVVKDNVWKYLLLTLIVYFGTSILTSALMFPLMLPFIMSPLLFAPSPSGQLEPRTMIVISLCFTCAFFPLMAALQGVIGTFIKSSLAVAYLRLTTPQRDEPLMVATDN